MGSAESISSTSLWSPILFNLYACVVAERWLERVCDVEGVGPYLFYKYISAILSQGIPEMQVKVWYTGVSSITILCSGKLLRTYNEHLQDQIPSGGV